MFSSTDGWARTALTGRIKISSSDFSAGQYVSKNLGLLNNLTTCDEYEDALRVRISPREDFVAIQCLNPTDRRHTWLGLAARADNVGFGVDSAEWAALTYTSGPSYSSPEAASTNTSGPIKTSWFLGYDGTLKNFWKHEGGSVMYCLDWSVEMSTKRIYAVGDRAAYVGYYYSDGSNLEAPIRLVFEPDERKS